MDEDLQMALALSLSMNGGGGDFGGFGGGSGGRGGFSSSSQNPKSGNQVGVESKLVCEVKTDTGCSIQVRSGDMTKEQVDVIVNAANKHLDHASGLAGAIVKNGGEMIQIESDIYISEHGPVPEGDVAVTGGGSLRAKKVIHAVGPIWHGGVEDEELTLRQAVWKSLKTTEDLGLASISIPAISSGIFNFPKELCAQILFQTALDFFATSPKHLNEIRFTNFDTKTVDIFSAEFKKRFGDGSTPISLGAKENTTTTTTSGGDPASQN